MGQDIEKTPLSAFAPATGYAALRAEAKRIRHAHVQDVYAKRPLIRTEGWALRSPSMMMHSPALAWCRGDGSWTIEQACLYPTRELAEAYANEIFEYSGVREEVVHVRHNEVADRRVGEPTETTKGN